jgi:multiple sugar transport system permease protein
MTQASRIIALMLLVTVFASALTRAEDPGTELIHLRVPLGFAAPGMLGPVAQAERRVMANFAAANPVITLTGTEGLVLPGNETDDMVPFMQIAGGIAPDVLSINFRRSASYIDMKLLYPLDDYVESLAGVHLPDSSLLTNADYFSALVEGTGRDEIIRRIPIPCYDVMRRRCPYGLACPFRAKEGLTPSSSHRHVWCFPVGAVVTGVSYDRGLLAEHTGEGIEQRAPRDWDELLRWSRILTHPERNEYGLDLALDTPSWRFLTFLYSAGAQVLKEDPDGRWRCILDSPEAVEAAYFYARLRLEKIVSDGRVYRGVAAPQESGQANLRRYGFSFCYLDRQFLSDQSTRPVGFGPVPVGPTGKRASEFNAEMLGIFAGLENDIPRRDAAWKYIQFIDGDAARRIRTEMFVSCGLGKYVEPAQLRRFNDAGRYDDLLLHPNTELGEAYRLAFAGGVPEPYGPNSQFIYDQINRPLGEMLQSNIVLAGIDQNQPEKAKAEIQRIFHAAADSMNEKMLGRLPFEQQTHRNRVAWSVVAAVAIIFAAVFYRVVLAFSGPSLPTASSRLTNSGPRQRWAWILMAPALSLIALWSYWPLVKGTLIAFQDYSVLGSSKWIGAGNFAQVLFDGDFWYSMKISLIYVLMFILFGFWVPIALALLLSEVPKGKILFRTVYYLPAVLSGLVVILLWKSFYSPDGAINSLINGVLLVLNKVTPFHFEPFQADWLDSPITALFCCLLPTIWAGMGPGCLIYLAALKTVPDDIYEAADIDGAGTRAKIAHIALPSIKTLVGINFVGAVIASIRGAGGFVLAMTGGGPYRQAGGATEVIGLKIFYTTFGTLQFGTAAAMAWVLGAMLIGFTVIQLQKLSRTEFRTAAGKGL